MLQYTEVFTENI